MERKEANQLERQINIEMDLLVSDLQTKLPKAEIQKGGNYFFVLMEDATFCIYYITQDEFQVRGKGKNGTDGGDWEIGENCNYDELLNLLLQCYAREYPETPPAPADNSGLISTPEQEKQEVKKFMTSEDKRNVGTPYVQPRDQKEIVSARMLYHSELANYLSEMLPCGEVDLDDDQVSIDFGQCSILIFPNNDGKTFKVRTYLGDQEQNLTTDASYEQVVKYAFEISTQVQDSKNGKMTQPVPDAPASQENVDDSDWNDATEEDVHSVLREYSQQLGKPTDIIRNKSLFDLRQGLLLAKKPQPANTLLEGMDQEFQSETTGSLNEDSGSTEVASELRGSRTHAGHPVSLNENRNASMPYADTLGGKVLKYDAERGAVFVNKSDLPRTKKLNYDQEFGVVLTDSDTPTTLPSKCGPWRGWNS